MNIRNYFSLLLVLCVSLFAAASHAHTSEIFFAEANANNSDNKSSANVLFLIDTSGSMCDPPGGGTRNCNTTTTGMYQLKQAFNQMIDGLDPKIKVGVGKFNGWSSKNSGYGGYVFYPVTDMTDANKQVVKTTVGGLQGTSNTPTMEAYSEMARYMLGYSPTDYAKSGEANSETPARSVNMKWNACASKNNGKCVGAYVSDDKYTSPINMNNQCETNHIIVMTDGAPTEDTDYSSVRNITGNTSNSTRCSGSYACQEELAAWLYNGGEDRSDRKSIRTWQVAFGISEGSSQAASMNAVAAKGGTENARFADDAAELAGEFIKILDLIDKDSRAISAPGVAVNQMSRLQHLGQLYYAVFQPEEVGVWQGNLKRYRLKDDKIVDANGVDAVDSNTGFFKKTATSFWNTTVDGDDATLGGAREVLEKRIANNQPRKIFYEDASGNVQELTQALVNSMSASAMGIPSGSTRTKNEVYNKLKTLWADPLHSVPVLVNYDAEGVEEDKQDNYIFVSTNGGMLHAIEAKTGTEKFVFMPYETFSQAHDFAFAPPLNYYNTRPKYGLDGSWVAWRQQAENSNKADKVFLYGGMRRGGYSYFALDVSNINNPKIKWKIDNKKSGFERLGQTWSTPTLVQLRIGGKLTPGLVFGGGYSPEDHDKVCTNSNMGGVYDSREGCAAAGGPKIPEFSSTDKMGNAIYIVHANTGELLWSASSSGTGARHTRVEEMKWAIPASIAVVDVNFDGVADYLYAASLRGQIFRVDLDSNAESVSSLVKRVSVLAALSNEGGTSGARRFFESPAVAYVAEGNNRHLTVAIASGYRAHPLEKAIEERVYVFKDRSALSFTAPTKVIGVGDLATVGGVNAGVPPSNEITSKEGWWMELDKDGEKAMASPAIFNGRLIMTTYKPSTDKDKDPCKVSYGESYLYVMDLNTSAPASLNKPTCEDCSRRTELESQVPVSQPQLLVQENDKVAVVVGTEVFGDVDGGDMSLRKRRWYPFEGTPTEARKKADAFIGSKVGVGAEQDGD